MITAIDTPEWMQNAICRSVGRPDDWFEFDGLRGVAARNQTMSIALICRGCPVRDECLEYAVANHEVYGIWGGLTPSQRRSDRR